MTDQKLPFLPGTTFPDLSKQKFHKSQMFTVGGDGRRTVDELKPGIGGEPLNEQHAEALRATRKPETSADLIQTKAATAGYVPSWAAEVSAGILRFEAWTREEAPSTDYKFRIRRVSVTFDLSDDTLAIASLDYVTGKSQGLLVKRHRVPRPQGQAGHLTVRDLNVGVDLFIYGRKYRLIKASDPFTVDVLSKLGIVVPASEELPADPTTLLAAAAAEKRKVLPLGQEQPKKKAPLKKFLEYDKKVLRFYCTWDNRDVPHGELNKLRLHYFLADDTIEVLQDAAVAKERGTPVTFLSRCPLPKDFPDLSELAIGASVVIQSRTLLIVDLDPFTRHFFTDQFGVTDFVPIEPEAKAEAPVQRQIPEHTGFGSEEDSLAACISLIPKLPKQSPAKVELLGKVLQFKAAIAPEDPAATAVAERGRQFTIGWKLGEEAIQIFEVPQRDIQGGKFFEGAHVKVAATGRELCAGDFFIGAYIPAPGHTFVLLDASKFSLKWMEEHPQTWPFSDFGAVIAKVKSGLSPAASAALEASLASAAKDEMVAGGKVREALEGAGIKLNEQEWVTVQRKSELYDDGSMHLPTFLAQLK